jgi:hypothetical protein
MGGVPLRSGRVSTSDEHADDMRAHFHFFSLGLWHKESLCLCQLLILGSGYGSRGRSVGYIFLFFVYLGEGV